MTTDPNPTAGSPISSGAADEAAPPAVVADSQAESHARADRRHTILAAVYNETQPAELPPVWRFLDRGTSAVRRLRCTATELAESLLQKFPVEHLLEAKVFEQCDSQPPTLSATFVSPLPFSFIKENGKLDDIYSAKGSLKYRGKAAVRDAKRRDKEQEPKYLAIHDDDVNLLNRLGYRCRWAAGLAVVTEKDLQQIFKPDDLGNLSFKYKFVLVGWQPAALDVRPPVLIETILNRFSLATQYYGFDPAPLLSVWLVAPSTLTKIKHAIELRGDALVRHLFAQSLADSVKSLADARNALAKPQALDYGGAERLLKSVIERSRILPRPNSAQAAVDQLLCAFNESVLEKLRQEAAASSDMRTHLLLLELAELADEWHQRKPILASARRIIAGQMPDGGTENSPHELKNRASISDRMLKIIRELNRPKR